MSQAFSSLYRRKSAVSPHNFGTRFYSVVQPFLGRFPQLDAHFPCRFLEFGRRRGNFFEKNRINPAVFRMFQFPRSQLPAGFFRFLQLPAKWERPALSFLSPLCECVAGSQIGHLLCEDCKFLIHVQRCHTIRITRKASPPCVPAGKTVQWTIFVKGTYRVVTKCDYSLPLRCKETK